MRQNLNKENFWNEAKEKYPKAVGNFCEWIDKYKKEVNWTDLFNGEIDFGPSETVAPKFHDLPIEMQMGIFLTWNATLTEHCTIEDQFEEIKKGVLHEFELIEINYDSILQRGRQVSEAEVRR